MRSLLIAAAAVGAVIGVASRDQRPFVREDVIVSKVDDLWLQATSLGVDADRWPRVSFRALEGEYARTRCNSGGHPEITVDTQHIPTEFFARTFVVPHEMAHVMVCLERPGAEPHGQEWHDWVIRLVPRTDAEEILALQEALDGRRDE